MPATGQSGSGQTHQSKIKQKTPKLKIACKHTGFNLEIS